ncbi:hypothetical protein OG196_14545 [Kitasatospora purpeofusca]|uniref:hypothetical protein n=1 Tax=Kitasatospora purpeofusca TaxID=67352 RepID=UPI002E15C5DA|nr:hypothetical protein OG196_14545 [Kitasatospora purpeofusca]
MEAGGALLVLGAIVGGIAAFTGDPKPSAAPAEGSPEWVQAADAKTRRSADLGRSHRDLIRGRGQEVTDGLCVVEWGKLAGEQQKDLDEYAFAGGCRMSP